VPQQDVCAAVAVEVAKALARGAVRRQGRQQQ